MAENPFADGLSVQLDASSEGLEQGISGAISRLGDFKTAAAGAGVALGALAAGGMAKSISAAADFDQALNESLAIMGDVSQAMEDEMATAAREVARTTTHSADEAAESFYFLASAGLDATESIAAMPAVAEFAQAGQMDMAEATDTATNVMSAYGIEAENITEVTDTMTATVTNHNQTMEGMSAAFKNAAPAAASMGVEMSELAAATGALGDVGIQAEEAGTALNSIMRRMAKRSGEAGQALDELGVQTTDAEGNMLPLVDIIEQLEEANLSSAEASAIFGRQMSAGSALVETGAESLREYQGDIESAGGVTEEVADNQLQTFNAQMDLFKSQLTDVGISIGSVLLPHLTTLMNKLSSAVDIFATINERTDGVAGAVVLLTAGFIGLVSAATLLAPAITAVGASLSLLLGPIGLVVAALAGLGIAYQKNLFGFRDAVNAVVARIRPALESVVDGFQALATRIGEAITRIRTQVIAPFLAWFVPIWEEHLATIAAELSKTIGVWIDTFMRFVEFVQPYVATFLERLSAWWGEHGDTVMAIVEPLMAGLKKLFEVHLSLITDALVAFFRLARGDFSGFKDAMLSIGDTLVTAVVDLFKWLYRTLIGGSVIPEMLSSILSAVRSFDLAGAFRDAVTGALRVVKGLASDFASAGRDLASGAASAFKSAFNAAIPSSVGIDPVTVAGKEVYGGGSVSLPSLDTGGVIETGGLAQLHAGETVVPADVSQGGGAGTHEYDVDVTIQGDADRDDVKRGVSDALRSINATR